MLWGTHLLWRGSVPLCCIVPCYVCSAGLHSQVWTWGEPWGEFSMQLDRSPRSVPDATDVAKIACGAFHNLALTRCESSTSFLQNISPEAWQLLQNPNALEYIAKAFDTKYCLQTVCLHCAFPLDYTSHTCALQTVCGMVPLSDLQKEIGTFTLI